MPVEGNDSKTPRVGGSPEAQRDGQDESVAMSGLDATSTLAQIAPPAWAVAEDFSSNVSRSGKELYELDRELQRGQASGNTDIADGYLLIRKLGTGSFGAVWEAENRLTHERVAIKFFTAGDSDWAKLLGEVGLLQTVEGCGGIVMVKEVRPGSEQHRPYYVMQLANSGSLADWLKTAGTLPPRERLKLATGFFSRVARAMAAVHRRGIHHCDLKPHNILLHAPEPGAPPEPLVADFGQAQLANDDTPSLGTFFYMPPDQIEAAQTGAPPDTRWDVYALGALMYELLTGVPPRRSPELVDQIKKAPKHLPTKMAVYREGLLAAPRPVAHRSIADPILTKIVDRCLNLRPERRPPDAGALVSLLDARARWRRIRPLLALAATGTLIIVALVAALGLWTANTVTERTKDNVSAEVTGHLARTAGYGTRAIEDRLQRYIVSLEQWSEKSHSDEQAVIEALAKASAARRGATLDGDAALPPESQELVRTWLNRLHKQRIARAAPGEHLPTLGVMLITDAETNESQSRGFYLARILSDGKLEELATYSNARDREFFMVDLSYRDYFHAGPGEADDVGKPHPVVRASHISHPFRSRGVDKTGSGTIERARWKLNIVTPIWDNPQTMQRVIGLLILGLDVEHDIKPYLYPTQFERPEKAAGYGIDQLVKVVLADQRGRWIWHPDCAEVLNSDLPQFRHPHSMPDLVRKYDLKDEAAGPWLTLDAAVAPGNRYSYSESDQYIDPVELELHGDKANEIACFTHLDPYERSRYRNQDETGKPSQPRRWVFVAQVDRKNALLPLDTMRSDIVRGGVAVVGALALIATGLWIGLVLVLRRLEFTSHG